jgi:hypothetical protein
MMTTAETLVQTVSQAETAELVDRYGRLKARAADTAAELDAIKATLVEREGEGKLEGELFRLSLAHSVRQTVDWKAVALHFAKKAFASDAGFDAAAALHTTTAAVWVARAGARTTK